MSKRKNQLLTPLLFYQDGKRVNSTIPHEIIGSYAVGARADKQGIAFLQAKFGKTRKFYMPNGYNNNRQTEKLELNIEPIPIDTIQILHEENEYS